MMHTWLKKRGSVWYIFYRLPGDRRLWKKSLYTESKREALQLQQEYEMEYLRRLEELERAEAEQSKYTIYQMLEDYAEHRRLTGHREEGVRYVEKHVRILTQFLPDVGVHELTRENLLKYQRGRKAADLSGWKRPVRNQTIQKEIDTLFAAYRWAISEESFKPSDERKVSRIPLNWNRLKAEPMDKTKPEDMGLLRQEFDEILEWAKFNGKWDLANSMMLARYLCMRVGGIKSVQDWKGIDLQRGTITFIQSKKRQETLRTLSLKHVPALYDYLKAAKERDSEHFPVSDHPKELHRAQERLYPDRQDGVRYNFTSFRHLFVYEAKEAGLHVWQVAAIVGHAESRLITDVYGKWGDIEANKALEELYSR